MSENDEKFHLFSRNFFFRNGFIDTKNAVLTGRPNFSCSITGNDLKKSPQKMQKLSKKVSSKCSQGEVESSLKAPLTFFGQPDEIFAPEIQEKTNCRFCKRLAPESIHWNWESSFDNSVTFFARIGQKNCSVSKNEKKIEKKLFFVKMLPWTRRMQF